MATSNVELRVDATQAVNALRQVNRASQLADAATQKLRQAVTGMSQAVQKAATNVRNYAIRALKELRDNASKAASALSGLRGVLASIGAGALVAGMVRGAASAEQLQLRLKMLSKEYGETARLQQFVAQSAATFGQSQVEAAQGVADVYARLRPLGVSLTQIETVYKGFNAVALASGTSAEAASGAFLQLSQALGSGTLQGDEFRSVAEQVPGILRLVANEMGVTVGQLKKLGSEGKITSDILINALAVGFEENGSKIKELLDQSPAQRFKEFQNATQALSNALGSELLPALTPIVSAATELLKQFGSLPGPIKTITAAVVGLTAAFIALAPAISAVKGLMAGLTLSGLLAAAPWLALAAGITAATVALAGYRSEAQKIGAAARGGGAAELATARTRLSNVGQDISLLERQRQAASGPQRGSIDRRLAALRAEQRQLRADVQAGAAVGGGGAAPSSAAAVTAAAAGGRAGGGRARAGDAERAAKAAADELARVNGIVRERNADIDLLGIKVNLEDQIAAAQLRGDALTERRLQGQQRLVDIQAEYARLLANPANQDAQIQEVLTRQGLLELQAESLRTERDLNAIDQQRIKDGAQLLLGKQQELELLQQTDPLKRDLLQIEQYLNSEEIKKLKLTDEQLGKLRDILTVMAQIKNKSDEMKQLYTDIGMNIKSGVVDAIQSAVDGTKTLGQVASDVLRNIANKLLDVAVNMALFGAMSGTGTGGGLLGRFFKPRAMGGSVTGGKPYLVGEKGPELFMPGRSGGIAPTGSFGGGVSVVVNVDASGTSVAGNEPDAAQLGRAVSVAVQAEIIKQQRPGGLLAATRR